MNRIILVMQAPVQMRYQEWWMVEFPKQLRKHFESVVSLGESYYLKNKEKFTKSAEIEFSPINESINFEMIQIEEYMKLELKKGDILFLADLSFPGIFPSILFHKRPEKCFSFCHASAKNKLDYYTNDKKQKFEVETGISKLFDAIFVGSKYHQDKLGWTNTIVTRLPEPPDSIIQYIDVERKKDIVSVARLCPQKVNKSIEKEVEYNFSKVQRGSFNSWINYSHFLSSSKILLITSKEDTFNYTILDAIKCGCIPVASNDLCFPEILPKEYLYNNEKELFKIIKKILNNELSVPEVLCTDQIDNFYNNISSIMKGNVNV